MWFKNIQIYQLSDTISQDINSLSEQLEALAFQACLPSLPASYGWVPPIDVDDMQSKLAYRANQTTMLCVQFEEKVLPATVIRQELENQLLQIEQREQRKVYQKEKQTLKDEITQSLLTRAFSKFSKLYAYIDHKRNWLVIDAGSASKIEKLLILFQRSFGNIKYYPLEIKKPAYIMTQWLINNSYPSSFAIDQKCVLQDPGQQQRLIRCQNQDLFASTLQALLKDGFEVQQLALTWKDRIKFTLTSEFVLKNIKFDDEVIAYAKDNYTESALQRFHTDLVIMSESCDELLSDLLEAFQKAEKVNEKTAVAA